jgi:hypothetical protein
MSQDAYKQELAYHKMSSATGLIVDSGGWNFA